MEPHEMTQSYSFSVVMLYHIPCNLTARRERSCLDDSGLTIFGERKQSFEDGDILRASLAISISLPMHLCNHDVIPRSPTNMRHISILSPIQSTPRTRFA